jgi:hypothetical protein
VSTKISIKYHRDEQHSGWFHLYREPLDEDVYLELSGVPFQAANTLDITEDRGPGSVAVRIPADWAHRLGLIPEAKTIQSPPTEI